MNLLFKNHILKRFVLAKKSSGGRNNQGITTVHHRGLGHKKKYILVDFFRSIKNIVGKVRRLEFDNNRGSYVCLICYKNSILSYVLAYDNVKINDFIIAGEGASYNFGNSTFIINAPIGSYVYNLEYFPGFGGKISRAAGSFSQILKKISNSYVLVKLKSKELRIFHKSIYLTYGIVSNKYKKFEKLYKASQTIYRGFRPVVRGEAKNPVDHPHGGNTSGGRHPVTPWGKLTKGVKTSNIRTKQSKNLIYKLRSKN
jgi:large subunit ribosomal protein L2